jgi:hypothetical protein
MNISSRERGGGGDIKVDGEVMKVELNSKNEKSGKRFLFSF